MKDNQVKIFIAEAIGTMVLVIGALAIKIIASGVKGWSIKDSGFATNGYGVFNTTTSTGSPGSFSLTAVAIAEVLLTALFVLVVIHTTRKDYAVGFGGLAAGLMLTLVHLISIPISNTSVNPARSFAVALFKGGDVFKKQLWAFWVFPLVGAVIAGLVAIYVLAEEKAPVVKSAKADA